MPAVTKPVGPPTMALFETAPPTVPTKMQVATDLAVPPTMVLQETVLLDPELHFTFMLPLSTFNSTLEPVETT